MSNKLKQDFDIYYVELKNFTKTLKETSQEIETDKTLSEIGKSEKVSQLQQAHEKNISELGERFQGDFGGRVSNIGRSLNGEKKNAVLDSIKKRFAKGEDISSDETSKLLLHEMRENKTIMRKSNFQGMLSNADIEQIRKTAQTLNDSQDIEKLEWLQEMTSLKGESGLSNSLAGQIDGIRTANLSDEQQNFKKVSEKISKGMKLFQYSLERSKTGEFVDARNEET